MGKEDRIFWFLARDINCLGHSCSKKTQKWKELFLGVSSHWLGSLAIGGKS